MSFDLFHHPYVLHSICEILLTFSSVAINFNVKLKIFLYMHGSDNIVLVLYFLVAMPSARRKRAGYLG